MVYERQRYDGWYNNMANPDWGSVDSRLARKTPATYEDGVYLMAETNRSSFGSYWFFIKIFTVFLHKNIYCRPSPRELSEAFMKGSDGHGSVRNRTTMLAFFGQVSNSTTNMRKKWLQCTLLIDKRKKYKQSPAQVVTSEILMASEMQSCPIEVTKIPISRSLLWWLDDDREIMLFNV